MITSQQIRNVFIGMMALIVGFAAIIPVSPQTHADADQAVKDFRAERHREFSDPSKSPLEQTEVAGFTGLNYFDIDPKYRVQARFERTPNEKKFNMPTSSGITKVYLKYGQLRFNLAGSEQVLGVYQSEALAQTEKYKNYLLIPFTDATNGKTTYGGGRYIDFEIPASAVVTLDSSKWFFGDSMLLIAMPVGLAFYGFFISRGGEPLLGRRLLD